MACNALVLYEAESNPKLLATAMSLCIIINTILEKYVEAKTLTSYSFLTPALKLGIQKASFYCMWNTLTEIYTVMAFISSMF